MCANRLQVQCKSVLLSGVIGVTCMSENCIRIIINYQNTHLSGHPFSGQTSFRTPFFRTHLFQDILFRTHLFQDTLFQDTPLSQCTFTRTPPIMISLKYEFPSHQDRTSCPVPNFRIVYILSTEMRTPLH